MWRVVKSDLCSGLVELERWSLDDLCDAHDVLDLDEELEELAYQKSRSKNGIT